MAGKQYDYDRFKKVMYLIFFLGTLTNAFISIILYLISAYQVILSPVIGTLIFMVCFLLLRKNQLTIKNAFLITAYTVAIEVVIHTHFIGWNAGFFYYFYLLSVVFLLDFTWSKKSVLIFNGSVIILTIITAFLYMGKSGVYSLTKEYASALSSFNLAIVGIVILAVAIHFSHTNGKKENALKLANMELEDQNKEISVQRNHLQILLKEVHHRVKNNLQVISSLMSLQSRSVVDQEALKVLNKSKQRIEAIALIHKNLYGNNIASEVNFKSYLLELTQSHQLIQSKVKCNLNLQEIALHLDIAVPLGLIVSEMITNAMKHAFVNIKNPQIDISFSKNRNGFELEFKDNGVGLPEGFSLVNLESLGVEIISALVEQLDAEITYENRDGAIFVISFKTQYPNLNDNKA